MNKADPTRSPVGTETVWAYTHVPLKVRADADGDLTGKWDTAEVEAFADRVETEIEGHAPGFRALVTGRHVLSPPALEAGNANLAGGALGGGTTALSQQAVFRPLPGLGRAETPVRGLFPRVGVGPPRWWRARCVRLQRRPRRVLAADRIRKLTSLHPSLASARSVATRPAVRSRRGRGARGERRPAPRGRRRRTAPRRARVRDSGRPASRARPARRRREPLGVPVASVSVITAAVSACCDS